MRHARFLGGIIAAVTTVSFAVIGTVPMASAAPSIGALAGAGERAGATRLSFTAGDSVKAQVDVGSGNLLVSVKALTLPGVNSPVQLGAFYNSAAAASTPVPRLGQGWGLDYTPDVHVVQNADNSVTYNGPGGLTGGFDLKSGSTTEYTSPAGFKVDLVKTASGWTLASRGSQARMKFGTSGGLVSREDRNGNTTTVAQSGSSTFKNLTITTPASTTLAQQAQVTTDTGGTTTVAHGDSSFQLRSVSFAKSNNTATGFTDARGRTTSFTYSGGLLTQISAPGGVVTQFGYDASKRVTSISQVETSTGGPGNSVTRLSYPSATQTLLADPDTNQSQAVSVVPHTTYTLNASQRVTKVVDAVGRERSKTYTANFDTASSTEGSGAGASITTNTWGANGGDSLTKSQSSTGAAGSLSYANASGPSQYSASGGTDDAGNASAYTYNGAGNQLTSTDAMAAQAKVTRNTDGTVATATSPGNGTNSSGYSYTNHQLTGTTSSTGSGLGARAYTYDSYGRLKTSTNGRGITTTLTYNDNDQITAKSFSGGTSVTYGYDTAGRNNSRVDATGTTSYVFDQLGRMTSRQNTAGGGAITYTYDKASRLATSSSNSSGGTISYAYDDSGVPTSISYPPPAGSTNTAISVMRFTNDAKGRRTGAYLQANADLSGWTARNLVSYDDSGRVSHVTADTGPATGPTPVVDISYCYVSGTTPAGGCTASATSDRSKLAWKKDNLSGTSTVYTYDAAGRLTKAAVSGGNTYDYGYNTNSDRTSADAQTLSFNSGNQISTTGYTYDATGNQTADPSTGATNIAYTGADQLKSLTKAGTSYTYSHAGTDNTELVHQTTPDGTYDYTYGRPDAQGTPVVEAVTRANAPSGFNGTATVVSDPRTGQPLMLRTSANLQAMYVYDGTPGSPIALLTTGSSQAFGYDYDPFGVPVVTQTSGGNPLPQNPYLFAGGVQDRTTGWVHYGYRYYNPKTGTFTQQDTLDAPLDPTNGNRYAYAGNDPINNTDPSGRAYGDVGIEACIVVCVGVSVGYDGDPDLTVSGGAGGEAGAVAYVGGGSGTNEGSQDSFECEAGDGVGAYGNVSKSANGSWKHRNYGGGVGVGIGGGCGYQRSYTF